METIRQKVIRHLSAVCRKGDTPAVHQEEVFRQLRLADDERKYLQDTLWALVVEKILKPLDFGAVPYNNPRFAFTDHGQISLTEQQPTPYDPEGYLDRLHKLIEPLDPVVKAYIEESLQAFLHNLPFSSVVMVGCAAEQVFLLVEDSLVRWSRQNLPEYKIGPRDGVKARYTKMLKRLDSLRKSLPDDVAEHLDSDWCAIFNLIRAARNDAGHPACRTVDMDDALSSLLTFPRFCERAMKLRVHLASQISAP